MTMTNPAFDYEHHGHAYSGFRRTDPRIAAYVHAALGAARTVVNVGAGAGSYEPDDRYVVAVEPSAVMRSQRQAQHKVPAVIGTADALPFDDGAFEAAMAMVTIHHWPHLEQGVHELRRVTHGPVVILTFDPEALDQFWNVRYFPDLIAVEKARYPTIAQITQAIGGTCEVQPIPIPLDCQDGFQEAYYGRPEAFLDPAVRLAQSAWGFLPEGVEDRLVQSLADELHSGAWDQQYGELRTQSSFLGALRLITALP